MVKEIREERDKEITNSKGIVLFDKKELSGRG